MKMQHMGMGGMNQFGMMDEDDFFGGGGMGGMNGMNGMGGMQSMNMMSSGGGGGSYSF